MLKKNKVAIGLIYAFAFITLSFIFVIGTIYNIPFKKFTGDPAINFNSNPFIGIISNIGVLFWCATASICFFSGILIWKNENKKQVRFLLYSGVFTTILLFDDFFMFHDYGVSYLTSHDDFAEKIIFLIYGLFSIWYLLTFFKMIMRFNYILIGLAFSFLGSSVLLDLVFESAGLQYFFEDGLKFVGIISWMLFYTTASYKLVLENQKGVI